MSSRRLLAPALAGFLALSLASVVSCGSRTGLFGEDALSNPDGGLDSSFNPDAPPDGPIPCTPGRFNFDLATAQLMFVIDRSGSMAFALDGTQPTGGNLPPGVLSRWDTLRDALFQTITPFDNTL